MMLLVAFLALVTMLQAPIPAKRSSSDVVPQTRAILTAIVAGDFATVEKQFTDDRSAVGGETGEGADADSAGRARRSGHGGGVRSLESRAGSRRDMTVQSYPALNHQFIAGNGASRPAEYQVPGHVAEEVIRDIATWIVTSR